MVEYLPHSLPVALVVEDDELVQEALKLALVEEAHLQEITAASPHRHRTTRDGGPGGRVARSRVFTDDLPDAPINT